jgi:hypothetical protein
MRHRLAALAFALVATFSLVATAVAGGWATASLDPGTPGPQSGVPTTIGFQVLQHGMTPNSSLAVVVHAAGATGGSISANATAQGAVGHYVATLTFPTDGAWRITWTSELDMAGSSATLNVAPVAAAAPPASTPVATPAPDTSSLLAGAGLAAIVIVLAGLFVALRRRRGRTSVPSVG